MMTIRMIALGVLLGVQGCLLPPAIEEVREPENRAPFILSETLSPGPTLGPERIHPSCTAIFNADVNDRDGDTLYWRVFLDYFAGDGNRPGAFTKDAITIFANETGKAQSIQFEIDPVAFAQNETVHTVELYITDRPFDDLNRIDGNRGRHLIDPEGKTASFMWPVILDNNLTPCTGLP